ncbi:uncharacterized protein LOC142825969 [Pelodiscus sinensis]|uniref:uncharacterized protein LOC142825969 n=1 Tax=Pelodiscus sinensis TaxID=13735 RepID=UPI003F6C56DB
MRGMIHATRERMWSQTCTQTSATSSSPDTSFSFPPPLIWPISEVLTTDVSVGPWGLMLPELSWPRRATQRAGTMEQLPALSPVLCILLLVPIWAADGAEIPAGCRRPIPNISGSAQSTDGLNISQEPRSLNTTVGDHMTLNCTFRARKNDTVNVLWLGGTGEDLWLVRNHSCYKGRLNVSSQEENRNGTATLTLLKLERRDSGFYYCCIKINNDSAKTGEGTKLTVIRRNQGVTENRKGLNPDAGTELTVYRAVVALAGVSIVILIATLLLRRRTAAVPETQKQLPAKGESRASEDASEGLHYGEITFQAPAHTEYASIQTQQL